MSRVGCNLEDQGNPPTPKEKKKKRKKNCEEEDPFEVGRSTGTHKSILAIIHTEGQMLDIVYDSGKK